LQQEQQQARQQDLQYRAARARWLYFERQAAAEKRAKMRAKPQGKKQAESKAKNHIYTGGMP
jgi:hypothetical protein